MFVEEDYSDIWTEQPANCHSTTTENSPIIPEGPAFEIIPPPPSAPPIQFQHQPEIEKDTYRGKEGFKMCTAHNARAARCKPCKKAGKQGCGVDLCVHLMDKSKCQTCKANGVKGCGKQLCDHFRNKKLCRICHPIVKSDKKKRSRRSFPCKIHGAPDRYRCKACAIEGKGLGGNSFCEHLKRRTTCKVCQS